MTVAADHPSLEGAVQHYRAGRLAEAERACRQLLRAQPDAAEVLHLLGRISLQSGQPAVGVALIGRAIALRPAATSYYVDLGAAYQAQGEHEEALRCFRRALELDPGLAAARSSYLFTLHYLPSCDRRRLFDEATLWGARHGAPPAGAIRPHPNRPDPERRLRVGYVSADFGRHPVGYFLEAVLRAHDDAQVEVFCYANSLAVDDLTERLRAAADHWHSLVGVDDAAAAEMIRGHAIDILVDLSGHTGGNRLTLFARKPAPVQATWLGYFDTTGLPAIDYLIADRVVCPEGDDAFYVERVVRLPDAYLCYAPQTDAVVPPLPALARGHATFGCFNRLAKVTPGVVDLWGEILRALPEACLCLKDGALSSPAVRGRVARRFAERGVAPERLTLWGASPYAEYLASYGQIDVALDPFPYTGGTTTAEALWMGVPVVTLAGDRFVSRMGATYLTAVGLDDLIASSPADYVAKAVALAGDRERLAALRAGLRQRMAASPLCDGQPFTRGLEAAYRSMWQAWCRHARAEC